MPRIAVVIPCLNEARTIVECVREADAGLQRAGFPGYILVVDSCSDDGSRLLAERAGAKVLGVGNEGYGHALHSGILAADADIAVTGDADMSYPLIDLGTLLEPIVAGGVDMVLGARLNRKMEAGAMPFLNRYLGTPVLSSLIAMLYGLPTTDCNSGMRAILTSKYRLLRIKTTGMEYASEVLVEAALHGLRYTEVPICYRKDCRNRQSHLRRWRDGIRHLRTIIEHRWKGSRTQRGDAIE